MSKRGWVRIAAVATAAVVGLVALLAVGLVLLQRSGWLAGRMAGLATSPGMTVSIGRLDGLPFRLAARDVTVADRAGVWLRIDSIDADWRLTPLLHRRLEISRTVAAGVTLLRAPVAEPSEPQPFALPSLPVSIALEHLAIERFTLGACAIGPPSPADAAEGKACLATAATADLRAHLRIDRGWRALDLGLVLQRSDAPGRLTVTAASPGDSRRLNLALALDEPPGGILARLAALPGLPAVRLSLAGDGTLEAWQGRLTGAAEGVAGADLGVSIHAADGLGVTVDGIADVRELLPEAVQPLVGRDMRLVGGVVRVPDGALRVEGLSATVAAGRVSLDGVLLPQLDLGLRVELPDLHPFSDLAGMSLSGAGTADGRLTGTPAAPRLAVDLQGRGLGAADLVLGAATAHAQATIGPAGWRLATTGTGRDLAAPGAPGLARVDWDVAAAQAGEAIVVDHAVIEAGLARFRLAGRVAADRSLDGTLLVEADDLTPLAALAGMSASGRGRIDGKAAGSLDGGFVADLVLDLADLSLGLPVPDALLGGRLGGTLRIRRDPSGALAVEQAELAGGAVALSASGRQEGTAIAGKARLQLPRLAVLGRALGTPLAGALTIDLDLGGSLAAPTGRLSIQGKVDDLETRASARISGDVGLLNLQDLILAAGGLTVRGDAKVALAGPRIDGTLGVRAADLRPLARLAGMPLAGSASGELKLAHGRQGQTAELKLEGRDLTLGESRLARLDAQASLRDLLGKPTGRLQLRLAELVSGTTRVTAADLQADGTLADAAIRLDARGWAAQPFRVTGAGALALAAAGDRLTLRSLTGSYGTIPLALRGQTVLVRAADGISLAPATLSVGSGGVTLSADTRGGKLAGVLELRALPASLARLADPALDLAGQLDGRVQLSGSDAQPAGELTLRVRGFGRRGDAASQRLAGDLAGRWRDGRLALEGSIGGLGREPLRLAGSLPLGYQPDSGPLLPPEGAIDGRITGALDVGRLLLLAAVDQPASGTAHVDISIAGTVAQPDLRGGAEMSDGRFTSPDAGLVLRQIGFKVTGDGRQLRLAALTGSDGAGGRIAGEGQLDLRSDGMPFRARVSLSDFTLRPPQGTVRAQGDLVVAGTMRAAAIEGRVTVDRGELRLPERLPAEIVRIEVVEVNGPSSDTGDGKDGRRAEAGKDRPAGAPVTLRLGVAVAVPGRVFVRGRGLESEWSGDLRIGGTTAAPDIDGNLTLVRGRFDLLGRTLTLTEGRIEFPGGLEPYVVVTATVALDTVQATVGLTGRASQPKLTVSSSPSLPQDEVLARVLFGRRLDQLSAGQAIQLASAVLSLTGGGGGGIVASIRAKTGLDVIDVTQGAGKDSAGLRVGKYVADKTFVKVEQGLTPDSSKVGVEVEVTDRISVETDLGAKSGGGVGINWKLDY